jgi:hypothetical protein
MARETCYCGLNELDTEVVDYCVMGEPCCSRRCYNDAMHALAPIVEMDGFHVAEQRQMELSL